MNKFGRFFLPILAWRADRRFHKARFYYEMSDIYARKGEIDWAIAELTKAIRIDSDNSRAYVCRGEHYCATDKYALALADFEIVIKMDPDIRGIAYGGSGESRRYNGLSDLARAHKGRAAVFSAEGAYRLAEAESSKATAILAPNNIGSDASEIDADSNSLREGPAATESASSADAFKLPLSGSGPLPRMILSFPLELWGKARWLATKRHYNRAQAFHDRGEYSLAIAAYNTALTSDLEHMLFPNPSLGYGTHPSFLGFRSLRLSDSSRDHISLAWCYVRRGLAYLANGEYVSAVADFDSATDFDNTNLMHWTIRECRRIVDQQTRKGKRNLSPETTVPQLKDLIQRVVKENRGY